MPAERRSVPPQSVERAIAILKAFGENKPERGINELARELDMHKSTVSRLVLALERGGLLSRNPETGGYRLGLELVVLAARVTTHADIRDLARPHLRRLSEQCQETANLSILEDGQVVNLEQAVPVEREMRSVGRVGRRTPPHCTAAGKVLLAYRPRWEVDHLVAGGLARYTPRTITDPAELLQELEAVRARGYGLAREELEIGLNVVSAPVRDGRERVVAAVSISGPASRLMPETLSSLAEQVVGAALQISRELRRSGLPAGDLME